MPPIHSSSCKGKTGIKQVELAKRIPDNDDASDEEEEEDNGGDGGPADPKHHFRTVQGGWA
jgi:hypothetical protein